MKPTLSGLGGQRREVRVNQAGFERGQMPTRTYFKPGPLPAAPGGCPLPSPLPQRPASRFPGGGELSQEPAASLRSGGRGPSFTTLSPHPTGPPEQPAWGPQTWHRDHTAWCTQRLWELWASAVPRCERVPGGALRPGWCRCSKITGCGTEEAPQRRRERTGQRGDRPASGRERRV